MIRTLAVFKFHKLFKQRSQWNMLCMFLSIGSRKKFCKRIDVKFVLEWDKEEAVDILPGYDVLFVYLLLKVRPRKYFIHAFMETFFAKFREERFNYRTDNRGCFISECPCSLRKSGKVLKFWAESGKPERLESQTKIWNPGRLWLWWPLFDATYTAFSNPLN